jgi:hypothetical protein
LRDAPLDAEVSRSNYGSKKAAKAAGAMGAPRTPAPRQSSPSPRGRTAGTTTSSSPAWWRGRRATNCDRRAMSVSVGVGVGVGGLAHCHPAVRRQRANTAGTSSRRRGVHRLQLGWGGDIGKSQSKWQAGRRAGGRKGARTPGRGRSRSSTRGRRSPPWKGRRWWGPE